MENEFIVNECVHGHNLDFSDSINELEAGIKVSVFELKNFSILDVICC